MDFMSLFGGGDSGGGKKFSSAASQSNINSGPQGQSDPTQLYIIAALAAVVVLAVAFMRR